MENIISLLKKIRSTNTASIPNIQLKNIFEESMLNKMIKNMYIEKMREQIPANKKYELAIINKNLNKKKEQDSESISNAIGLFVMLTSVCMFSLVMSLQSFLSEKLKNNSFSIFYFIMMVLFPIIIFLLFYIKKIKKENNKNTNKRVVEIKSDVKESEYKDIIKNATLSILNDLETIEGYTEETEILKRHLIIEEDLFENNKIEDIEKGLKENFYEELTCLEKDISNKMIIKKDLNNELLKMKIPTYMK